MTDKDRRDSSRTVVFYTSDITDVEASSEQMRKRIPREDDANKRGTMHDIIFMNHLEIAKIMYCRGDDFKDIRHPIRAAINSVVKVEGVDIVKAIYTDVLDIVSLAILLKMPVDVFRDLNTIVDRCDGRDQVLDHLISYGTKYDVGETDQSALMMYNNFNRVIECCEQKGESCQKFLLDYLNTEWHEGELSRSNLRNQNKPDISYSGVYCFSVAAMAYINDLSDNELRKSEYYPTDIAEYVRRQ